MCGRGSSVKLRMRKTLALCLSRAMSEEQQESGGESRDVGPTAAAVGDGGGGREGEVL